MDDKQIWDQIAILTTQHAGRNLVGTVVGAEVEKFEVFPTLDYQRVIIAVPFFVLKEAKEKIANSLNEEQNEAIDKIARTVHEESNRSVKNVIADFVSSNPEVLREEMFTPMQGILYICDEMFREYYGITR